MKSMVLTMPARGILLLCLWFAMGGRAAPLAEWTISDHVGHHWQQELVFFELPKSLTLPQHYAVVDATGTVVPHQLFVASQELRQIAVLIDLLPFASDTYTLVQRQPPVVAEWQVTEGDRITQVDNGAILVQLGALGTYPLQPFMDLPPPLVSLGGRKSPGTSGHGALHGVGPARLTARQTPGTVNGPLFRDFHYTYAFADGARYDVTLRLILRQPVVLVKENFTLSNERRGTATFVQPPDLTPAVGVRSPLSEWLIDHQMGWQAIVKDTSLPQFTFKLTHGLSDPQVVSYALQGPQLHTREKLKTSEADWVHGLILTPYQARGNRVTAITFADEQKVLGLFSRHLSLWKNTNESRVPLPWLDEGVEARFLASEGSRQWGLWVGTPELLGEDKAGQHGKGIFSRIRQIQVKYGQTPLDKVKDWTLAWQLPPNTHYPRLYYSPASIARMRKNFPELSEEYRNLIAQDKPALALLTEDAEGLRQAFKQGDAELGASVDAFLNGGHDTQDTYTHRFQEVVRANGNRLDVGLACPDLSQAEKKLALARAAFLAYKISDLDYWRYNAYGGGPSNPNMMSIATHALATLAALVPDHPRQRSWFELCRRLVSADILHSIGPRGAWLESPGYQGAGNTPINQTVLILRRHLIVDLTRDTFFGERLMSVSTYYANLLTPPDPRFDGLRKPMALGDNTPFWATFPTYLANAGRQSFPTAAGNAIWAWEQMGRPVGAAALLMFQEHVLDGSIDPIPISGKTEVFPGFGIIFRHGFDTPHETHMTLRQNNFAYGHYDEDQGSVSLFAKGAPLALDWIDYSPNEAAMHNRVDYQPRVAPWLVPSPDLITLKPGADYARMHQAGLPEGTLSFRQQDLDASDWQRQLILVKDTGDPADATYIVFHDRVSSAAPNSWNLWLMAAEDGVAMDGYTVHVTGQNDIDALIAVCQAPEPPRSTGFHRHMTRSYIKMTQDQLRIQMGATGPAEYGVVLFPYRRGVETPPAIRQLQPGVIELSWPDQRRHLLFLGPEPFAAQVDGIDFFGRAALVKFAPEGTELITLDCDLLTQ